MPLVQVDLPRKLFNEKRAEISDAINAALIEGMDTIPEDKFQIFRPRDADEVVYHPTFNGVERKSLMVIQVLMVNMHSAAQKKAFFAALVKRLGALGVRSDDIFVGVTENTYHDWYGGKL
jgi:phenylpyruvate tautomerase PptA (4-oxalocrotonate tautomerase family)